MKGQSSDSANVGGLCGRITRARAAALRSSGFLALSKETTAQNPSKATVGQSKKRILQANSVGAAASDENTIIPDNQGLQRKRRAVLQDVTNVCCEKSYKSCINASKFPVKSSKQPKRGQGVASKVAPSISVALPQVQATSKSKLVTETTQAEVKGEEGSTSLETVVCRCSGKSLQPLNSGKKGKEVLSGQSLTSCELDYKDIDTDHTDPQLCSLYAANIHENLRVAELNRRPSSNLMETIQRDITKTMRGILVDWLVEVSEEYKLESDTLFLTVYLIDWFLCHNYIERQRLQLLGITCTLIASKYEEVCAPRVDDFCFITDNTYSRDEVLKMETQVLKFFGFQLFAPTAKTFLRRFLRAAQASYKSDSVELEYLANFLAELTLLDNDFLKFLPSIIAASSVFLARWTLDQSNHPWNATLEHYTYYSAADLKIPVFALQDLHLNTNNCPLNAIRSKYRQAKFKSVAALSSPKLLETLF